MVDEAVDLKVDLSGGASKAGAKRAARTKQALAKAERIEKLHSRKKQLNLVKGVVVAQAGYGTEAVGLSPAQIKTLRTKVTSALGYKQGMCSTTLLALHQEPSPAIAFRWKHLKEWISLWFDCPELHGDIKKAWKVMAGKLRQIESSAARWRQAQGPIGGMIAMLMDLGWTADQPDRWTTSEQTDWWMSEDPMDLNHVKNEFYRVGQLVEWAKAARHHCGAGAEGGVLLGPAQRLRRKLKRDGLVVDVGLLDAVVTSALWTSTRCSEAGYRINKACKLCGHPEDSEGHRLWHCPIVIASWESDIRETNFLIDDATKLDEDLDSSGLMRWQRVPCFWLRSLIPTQWVTFEEPKDQRVWLSGLCGQEVWPLNGRHVYIDESAGECSSNPWLRRAGWGLVVLGDDREVLGAASATHPGPDQSQTSAVLAGVLYLLTHSTGDVVVRPDCNVAVDGLVDVLHGRLCQFGTYAQVWHEISQVPQTRTGNVTVKRVDAHVDVRDYLELGYPVEDWLGDKLSDFLAGNAAKANGFPLQAITNWDFFNGRSLQIL